MMRLKRYSTSLILVFLAINLPAQNLTGTWEGDIGTDQFLQLNVLQTGNKICGYTYDHEKENPASFCKAFFEGHFEKEENILYLRGVYFLKNSGTHHLMNLRLNYKRVNGEEVLEQNPFEFTLSPDSTSFLGRAFRLLFGPDDSSDYVHVKKISGQPYEINELMKDCISRDRKDTVVQFITTPKQKDSIPPPVITKKDTVAALPKTISQRKNTEQSRITVNTKSINLKVYDNAIMDGDTVSILYNGRLLLSHQLLSEKGIDINLQLDDDQTRHEIVLFAENLGSIPPNTALIVITAGEKRYELFASASLEENAVLVFEYRPK